METVPDRFKASKRGADMSRGHAERYDQLERYITSYKARRAFRALLATERYCLYPNRTKLSVNFRDGFLRRHPTPYSFIVAREWLKFYIRKEAFAAWASCQPGLTEYFGTRFDAVQRKSNESRPEWRVRLGSVDDVQFLYAICPANPYPLVCHT